MSILHLNQIARRVLESFESHIPKDDLTASDPEYQAKVQTRCLAAFAVQAITDCTDLDAGAAVTDGGDDNGIDAIFYSSSLNCLVIVQSKWIKDGNGEPSSADVSKFCNGVRDLVNSEFDRFNDRVKRRQSSVENALSNFNCRLVLALVHTGQSTMAEHARRQIEDLLRYLNDASDIASSQTIAQEKIYSIMQQAASGGAITLDFSLSAWGKIENPHTAYYGMVTGHEVAEWWNQYGERLFQKNLRSMLGGTDVNKQIASTIENRPDDFWYFNNGITLTAMAVDKTPAGGGNRDLGTFRASGAFVVNGAQTVSTVGRFDGSQGKLARIQIPLRVISLDGASEDYGGLITRTNNTQNRIEARDFVCQDQEQQRIRAELQMDGIEYHLARSEGFKPTETAFDLEEATVALACATGDPQVAAQAKREIGRFWSDLEKGLYKRLFNPTISSLYVYHAVLLHRKIEQRIRESIRSLERRSGKRYGVLVHGNRLIAAIVFHRQQILPRLGQIGLNLQDHGADIDRLVGQAVDGLTYSIESEFPDNFPAVIFKNPTKSKTLFDHCIQKAKQQQLTIPVACPLFVVQCMS